MSTPPPGGILVPLDGSEMAEQALAAGVSRARKSGATLHLVTVHQPVMTTHGRGGLSRLWLGSVADRMLRRLDVPVLLLHPREVAHPAEFRRIFVALDGEIEEPVVDAALALGGPDPPARYVFTRVVEPTTPVLSGFAARPGHLPRNWNEVREIEARNHLARLTDQLHAKGLDATSQVLMGRGIAGQVIELADAISADCIVGGTHGARGMERLMLGSVADKLVRGATVPVLVVPVRPR